jgi:hypothetical protein
MFLKLQATSCKWGYCGWWLFAFGYWFKVFWSIHFFKDSPLNELPLILNLSLRGASEAIPRL